MADDSIDQTAKPPAQIPLLEDVVFNTQVPVRPPTAKKQKPGPRPAGPQKLPQATDLFADTFPPAPAEPAAPEDDDVSQGVTEQEIRARATDVVDTLVKEYSIEIVRRLKDELGQILEELDPETGVSKSGNTDQNTPDNSDN